MAVRLDNNMIQELRKAFSLRDYDEDGKIFSDEIGPVIRSVKGLKPLESEIQEIKDEVNKKGGMLDLNELVTHISKTTTNPEPERAEDLAEMFRMYDKDGRGYISVRDLRHLLTNIGEKLSEREADDLIRLSGCLERDKVNYNKFVKTVLEA